MTSVGKRYHRGPWVFADVSLEIEPGQVVAIGGANGSGKSTLLNVIAGLTRPTTGTVSPRPRSIGYVPERFSATSRMSASAYLTHMGRLRGLPSVDARRAGAALLDRFGFAGQQQSTLRTLSKGNAQKVALAQAIIVPPALLVLDEPWTGLDEVGQTVLADVIAETTGAAGIVVLSTHPGTPAPVVDAHRYVLAAGTLAAAPISADAVRRPGPSSRVLLRRTSTAVGLPPAWSRLPAAADIDGAVTAFTVDNADRDRFLLDVLGRGWSVVAVIPAHDGTLPGSSP